MEINKNLTIPNFYKGKIDPGIPVYLTGIDVNNIKLDYFNKMKENGFGCYRWDKIQHFVHNDINQVDSQRSFLTGWTKK